MASCQAKTVEVDKPREDRAQAGNVRQRVISQLALTKPPPQPSEHVTAPEEGAQSGNERLSLTDEDQEMSDVDPCDDRDECEDRDSPVGLFSPASGACTLTGARVPEEVDSSLRMMGTRTLGVASDNRGVSSDATFLKDGVTQDWNQQRPKL